MRVCLGFLSAHGLHGLREASLWYVRHCPCNHLDAVDDGADAEAQSTAGAAVLNHGEMSLGVEHNGLVSSVVTGHVALPTVNAHFRIDQSLHLLLNIELLIGTDVFQSFGDHIFNSWHRSLGSVNSHCFGGNSVVGGVSQFLFVVCNRFLLFLQVWSKTGQTLLGNKKETMNSHTNASATVVIVN